MAATDKPLSKTEILNSLAETTELSRKEVGAVLEALEGLIEESIGKEIPFNLPGLLKVYVHTRKAQEARPGRNPSTGEEIMISAKPETKVVKVRPLKKLKETLPEL